VLPPGCSNSTDYLYRKFGPKLKGDCETSKEQNLETKKASLVAAKSVGIFGNKSAMRNSKVWLLKTCSNVNCEISNTWLAIY